MFDRYSPAAQKIREAVIRMLSAQPAVARPAPPPDPAAASLEELDTMIDRLVDEELEISRRRRIVHRRLELLWAERERRHGQ